MEEWIQFWTVISMLGFLSYVVTFVIITPLGLRDIFAMFHRLNDPILDESAKRTKDPGED